MIAGVEGDRRDAVRHHENSIKLGDYESAKINSRTNFEYDVKGYYNSGDIDGFTVLRWEESLTTVARTLISASTVATYLIAASPAIAFSFGGLIPIVIAAAIAAATYIILSQKREYVAHFATATGEMITQDEANKIQDQNRELIRNKLNEISELLNFDLEDGERCDLDKAKEELDELSKKHKNILSNRNKGKFEELFRDYSKKKVEVEKVCADEHSKTLRTIQEISSITAKAFEDAQKHRDVIYQKQMAHIARVIDGFSDARNRAEEKFAAAKADRDAIEQTIQSVIGAVGEALSASSEAAERKFNEAQAERDTIYQKMLQAMNASKEAIEESKQVADVAFRQAKAEMERNDSQQKSQFQLVLRKVTGLKNLMKESFEKAKSASKEEYNKTSAKILVVTENISKIKDKAKNIFEDLRQKFVRGVDDVQAAIGTLSQEQQQGFARIMQEKEQGSKKLEEQILLARAAADQKFDEAAKRLQSMSEVIQAQVVQVNEEVEESRRIANEKFEEASKQREEINSRILELTKAVNLEVLESRRQADEKFKQAVAERKLFYEENKNGLDELKAEVLESRRIADQKFDDARLHMEEIHKETSQKIEILNQSVNKLRQECDSNFEKARVHCQEIYEKTADKLNEVNSSAHDLREQCQDNFVKALSDASELYQKTAEEMNLLSVDPSKAQIEQLKQISIAFKNAIGVINNEQHEVLQTIKSSEKSATSFKDEEIQAHRSNINKIVALSKNPADSLDARKAHLDEALKMAIECASKYGKGYQFETIDAKGERQADYFMVQDILRQKSVLEFDKMRADVLSEISGVQKELINSCDQIEALKTQLLEESYSLVGADRIERELRLNDLRKEAAEVEGRSKQLSEDLALIYSVMNVSPELGLIGDIAENIDNMPYLGDLHEAKGD